MIAVILPSRGLIHSRTMESVLRATVGYDPVFFFSHENPIPDCFNKPIAKALKRPFSHIFIVEEDIVLQDDTLQRLLDLDVDIAVSDYNLEGGTLSVQCAAGIVFAGTGCLLVKRGVMQALFPFRSNVVYDAKTMKPVEAMAGIYGAHDVDFFVRAQAMARTIGIDGDVAHLRVTETGERYVNNGVHKMEEL